MTIIPIPVGPGPAPEYRWVGAEAARRIRARCTTTGLLLMLLLLLALVATVVTVVLGGRLPTADDPIHGIAMVFVVGTAVLPLIVGIYALGARRYVSAEHIDVAGGRLLGRGMLAMAVFTLVCAALGIAVLLLIADSVEKTDGVRGAVAEAGAYALLPVSCATLAVVGALLTRKALRPTVTSGPGKTGP